MSQKRNFPDDFFGDAEDDPIKDNNLLESAASAASATQDADRSPQDRSARAQGDSVFAASASRSVSDDASPASGTRERAIMVTKSPDHTVGVDALNRALTEGWSIEHVALMSGSTEAASMHFSALVVLSKEE